jgi:hypothetical protein
MTYLDAALAFAITMLAISTVATQITNWIRNALGIRNDILKRMVGTFLKKEFRLVLDAEMCRLQSELEKGHADRIKESLRSPPSESPDVENSNSDEKSLEFEAKKGLIEWLRNLAIKIESFGAWIARCDFMKYTPDKVRTRSLAQEDLIDAASTFILKQVDELKEMSSEDLIAELKKHEMGRTLLTELGNKANGVFDQIARRYDAFGARVTESFKRSSQSWATGIAFLCALVLNIDSIFVAQSYVKNKEMRDGVIANLPAVASAYSNAVAQANELDKAAKTNVAQNSSNAVAAAAVTNQFASLNKSYEELQNSVKQLSGMGIPIGWDYFPHCLLLQKDGCSPAELSRGTCGGSIKWLLGCCITGLLAGLGAPFWYDVILGIQKIAKSSKPKKE